MNSTIAIREHRVERSGSEMWLAGVSGLASIRLSAALTPTEPYRWTDFGFRHESHPPRVGGQVRHLSMSLQLLRKEWESR
mgnify:CR=1 FL=1